MTKPTKTAKEPINEIFILRAIACLSIVLLHSIALAQSKLPNSSSYFEHTINSIRVLLTFGTPAFVFISTLLISYSYPNGLPKNFLSTRIKLILIPYLAMAVFYACFSSKLLTDIPGSILFNILGGFHGYFVLIIFQFYVICYFLHDFFIKQSARIVILSSLAITIIYLSIFNFFEPPVDSKLVNYFWKRWHWVPFFGWLFYFSVAYYCGRNYQHFTELLQKYKKTLASATLILGTITIYLSYLKIIPLSSKSVAMVFFALSIIFLIYSLSAKTIKTPALLEWISEYSFSIYLLHMFFLVIIDDTLRFLGIDIGIFNSIFLFTGSIGGSIAITYILNKIKFGKYLVGRANPRKINPLSSPSPKIEKI